MIKIKSSINQVPMYIPGRSAEDLKHKYAIKTAIKLASNENPYGISDRVKVVLKEHTDHIYFYPDGTANQLRAALAMNFNIPEEQFLIGAGLEEIIQMISATVLEKGTNVIMSGTTFPIYKKYALIECAEIREIPAIKGKHDLENMIHAIDDDTRLIWVCNPNNPTGTYINEQQLIDFLDTIPNDILVVLDEAYYEYVTAADYPRSLALLNLYSNLIILRTFSKAYGLAGLRIGYAIALPEVIATVNKVRKTFNTSSLAQIAAIAALQDQEFVKQTVKQNAVELAYAYEQLDHIGISYYRSQANFVYMDTGVPSNRIADALLTYGMIIRPMEGNCIRVSIGTHEQNRRFFEVLKNVLPQVSIK